MSIRPSEARSIIRKARRRVPEGESISSLNLTAMMDMMTILLVFMIMTMSLSTSPLSIAVALPPSTTQQPQPEQAKTVTIAKDSILIEGTPVVKLVGGDVDASEKAQGQFGIEIAKLKTVLSEHHEGLYQAAQKFGGEVRHELIILADKDTPYRLLYSVMYTAGRASAKGHPDGPGFTNFRLIVVRNELSGQSEAP
jgi:biopolymer transport protein ExbD